MKVRAWLALALILCLTVSLAACGSNDTAVYVQSVSNLTGMGGIAAGDRFPGMVVSENVTEIKKDSEKTVKEVLVKEGDDVNKGDKLFEYDTDELQLSLEKKQLELEQLNASIENYQQQIKELEKERGWASGSDKLQYTIQIQTAQVDMKEAELNAKAKQTEVTQAENLLKNATVVSPIKGRIQSINESGTETATPHRTLPFRRSAPTASRVPSANCSGAASLRAPASRSPPGRIRPLPGRARSSWWIMKAPLRGATPTGITVCRPIPCPRPASTRSMWSWTAPTA